MNLEIMVFFVYGSFLEKLLELLLIVCEDIRNRISLQRSVAFLYVSNIQPENKIENICVQLKRLENEQV